MESKKPVQNPSQENTTQTQPVRSQRRFDTPTPVIAVLLGINVLIFLIDQFVFRGQLYLWGGSFGPLIVQGEYWRIVTHMFLHGNIPHIVFNMLFLYRFGNQMVKVMKVPRFLAIYFLSGFAGAFFSIFIDRAIVIGASGALFGLLGAEVAYGIRNRALLQNFKSWLRSRVIDILFMLSIGLIPGIHIANGGHIGGFIGGLVIGWGVSPQYELVQGWFTESLRAQEAPDTYRSVFVVIFATIFVVIVFYSLQFIPIPG